MCSCYSNIIINVKKLRCFRYRPGVVQRVGRETALFLLDRGTRRRWVVSSTPRSHFTPGKEPVPILQEAGWAPGPVWMGGKSRPHRDSIPHRPARSQLLYRLSYRAHIINVYIYIHTYINSCMIFFWYKYHVSLASCTMGTGSFLAVKSGRGVTLTPHPFQCRGQERV